MKFVKNVVVFIVSLCSAWSVSASNVPFVVGGQDALHGEYPWQVMLTYNNNFTCGGSILNKRWVLTAAHCTHGRGAGSFGVFAGAYDRTQVHNDQNVQDFGVTRIVTHPGWNPSTLEHDMALLELDADISFGDDVQPVELSQDRPQVSDILYISGWGRTGGNDPSANILQEGRLEVVDQQACANALVDVNTVTDDMICAGFEDGVIGGCYGDSGGPLVYQSRNGVGFSGGWRLAGVVSWGRPGCLSYTVFSDVSSQSADNEWIATTVGDGAVYGDIDGDGCVSTTDYDLYLVNNGRSGGEIQPAEADINGDGIVNYDDYVILIQNWGEGCL